jgi:hypothetical protein
VRGKRLKTANKIARKVFKIYHNCTVEEAKEKEEFVNPKAMFGSYRKTRVRCSRPCCGNRRRHFGEKTLRERKFEEGDKEWLG